MRNFKLNELLYLVIGVFTGYLLSCLSFLILLCLCAFLVVFSRSSQSVHCWRERFHHKKNALMPLKHAPTSRGVSKENIFLSKQTVLEIKAYCDWASLDFNAFMEKSALLVFAKDKDWKLYQKTIR